MAVNVQAYRTPNRLEQKRKPSCHIIMKTLNVQNKERILKAVRRKGQVTYKGRIIRITPDFSTETLKTRRSQTDLIQTLRKYKSQLRIPYPAKLGETKIFHDKTKFKKYLSTNPALQRILKQNFQHKEGNHTKENTRNQTFHNKPKKKRPPPHIHTHSTTFSNKTNMN